MDSQFTHVYEMKMTPASKLTFLSGEKNLSNLEHYSNCPQTLAEPESGDSALLRAEAGGLSHLGLE